ncbi:hypothetical protein SHIRM173S_06596 [Streptomyces hirsutus]
MSDRYLRLGKRSPRIWRSSSTGTTPSCTSRLAICEAHWASAPTKCRRCCGSSLGLSCWQSPPRSCGVSTLAHRPYTRILARTGGPFCPSSSRPRSWLPLNLPEVSFALPFSTSDDDEDKLPVGRALREAVPGRVSRRFGYRDDRHRTWLEVPTEVRDTVIDLSNILDAAEQQGRWDTGRADVESVEVTRPRRIKLAQPDKEIATSSQGVPLWATQFVNNPAGPPVAADVPKVPEWRDRVLSVGFATHASGNPTEVRRMTYGAVAEVRSRSAIRSTTAAAQAVVDYQHEWTARGV